MALDFLVESGPHGAVSPTFPVPAPLPPLAGASGTVSRHFRLSALVGRDQGHVKHPVMHRTALPTTSDYPAPNVGGAGSETPF